MTPLSYSGLTTMKTRMISNWKTVLVFLPLIGLGIVGSLSVSRAETESADDLMKFARVEYDKGMFDQAAQQWMEAAHMYEQRGETLHQSDALLYLGEAFHRLGQSRNADLVFTQALNLAQLVRDPSREARILGRRGNVSFFLGDNQKAVEYLTQALTLIREEDQVIARAALLNDLGNVLAVLDRTNEALGAYVESSVLSKSTGNLELEVVSLINAANAEIQQRSYVDAKARLDQAWDQITSVRASHDKAYAYLKIGLTYDALHSSVTSIQKEIERERLETETPEGLRGTRQIQIIPNEEVEVLSEFLVQSERPSRAHEFKGGNVPDALSVSKLMSQAADAFQQGADLGVRLEDPRAEAYGWGYLGHLYEKNYQWAEALELTQRALAIGQRLEIPESQYQWHWQAARIHRARGEIEEARKAYQQAVYTLQPMRHEFLVGAQTRHRPFRETVGPLFFELADLLLRKAKTISVADQSQQYLLQARDTVESFKAAELQDYFRDQCVQTALSQSFPLEKISETTAVLYPVILPDRLELLLGLQDGFRQISVSVPGHVLTREVRVFRQSLEDPKSTAYLQSAQQLYARLIEPLESYLHAAQIRTLVVVPDGALRTIPLSALHDGEEFLIHKFALATTPGLTLTDPAPIKRSLIQVLALGITEPVTLSSPTTTASTVKFSPLPNVSAELEAVKQVFPSKVMLNQQFQDSLVEEELKGKSYNIVHIASHGLVTTNVKDTFILAHDGPITMDRLAEIIGLFRFRDSPLELLTLSACQTAEGDDRAALGLAGVAVKAGARSALATLWFIDDEVTSQLVPEFYRQLKQNPQISKAEALQRAQLKFIEDERFQHPSYWGPFLLINNWL